MTVQRRLLGAETEYALSALDRAGAPAPDQDWFTCLFEVTRTTIPHLRDHTEAGFFLENGGRFYVDSGFHPEMSTPECEDPWDVVCYVRAGDALMLDLASSMKRRFHRRLGEVRVSRHNVDYLRRACTWGSHESYMTCRSPVEIADDIIPHLVTRIIFTGAGGFWVGDRLVDQSASRGATFVLSPRVRFLHRIMSSDSMGHRGIFHTKDEPMCNGDLHRLHLLCGESLSSDLALWLRFGTTAIVVRLAEAGLLPTSEVALLHPLFAIRKVSRDVTCKETVRRRRGPAMTAVEIQRIYLERAEECLRLGHLPPWSSDVCWAWREILDELEQDPARLATRLDWPAKRLLFRRQAERRDLDWSSFEPPMSEGERPAPRPSHMPSRRAHLPDAVRRVLYPEEAARPDEAVGLGAEDETIGEAQGGSRPIDPKTLELLEIDTRCGELGEHGILEQLAKSGALRHRLVGPARVKRAVKTPPVTGRGRLRGETVKKHAGQSDVRCMWSRVVRGKQSVLVDLSNPFPDEASPNAVPGRLDYA